MTDRGREGRGPLVPKGPWGRIYLVLEFLVLFVVIPVFLYFDRHSFGQRIIPSLVLISAACLTILLCDRNFDRRRLWNARHFRRRLAGTLLRLIPAAVLLTLATAVFRPELLLSFPRSAPRMWLVVMVFYPVFSVYPQELIFRTFLFHRYRVLFRGSVAVFVSGLSFGIAHLFFANALAPILSAAGGLLFARTYARTGSTLQASLEHGLWGDLLFTVGLGWYFYGGAIGQ